MFSCTYVVLWVVIKMPTLSVNNVVQELFKFQLTAFLCFACMAIWSLWSPFMSHSTLILLPYVAHPLFFITLTGPAFLSVRFSLGIQYMLLRLCEWEKDREIIRERTQRSFSFVSLSCCLFCPLLCAADVRTTFSPITSKGTSCIWTIRWGNAWMHGPLSSCRKLNSLNALLLLLY